MAQKQKIKEKLKTKKQYKINKTKQKTKQKNEMAHTKVYYLYNVNLSKYMTHTTQQLRLM